MKELHCPNCGDGILYLQPRETLSKIMYGDEPRITDREYTIDVKCGECNAVRWVIKGEIERPDSGENLS